MLTHKGERETPDDKFYHPCALTPSTQAIYGMDRLRKNRKRYFSYRFLAIIYYVMTQVSFKQGLKKSKRREIKPSPRNYFNST